MHTRKNEPCQESNRAIFAHVKEEMDEPRMSASAREEEKQSQPDHAAAGEIQQVNFVNARMDAPDGEK
jgi:hypothetical protein